MEGRGRCIRELIRCAGVPAHCPRAHRGRRSHHIVPVPCSRLLAVLRSRLSAPARRARCPPASTAPPTSARPALRSTRPSRPPTPNLQAARPPTLACPFAGRSARPHRCVRVLERLGASESSEASARRTARGELKGVRLADPVGRTRDDGPFPEASKVALGAEYKLVDRLGKGEHRAEDHDAADADQDHLLHARVGRHGCSRGERNAAPTSCGRSGGEDESATIAATRRSNHHAVGGPVWASRSRYGPPRRPWRANARAPARLVVQWVAEARPARRQRREGAPNGLAGTSTLARMLAECSQLARACN